MVPVEVWCSPPLPWATYGPAHGHDSQTAVRYRDEILEPHIVPMLTAIGHSCMFINDNARPHRAQPMIAMVQESSIESVGLDHVLAGPQF